ncbi:MAG: hypothetical protein WCO84_09640, partial [bacterium]
GTMDYYNVQVDDHLFNLYQDSYTTRFGFYRNVEVSEGEELLKGDFIQLDPDGKHLDKGISVVDTKFLISTIKDEEIKKKFIGIKIGEVIVFDPKAAFPNATDLKAMLKIEKGKESTIENDFEFTVKEILLWTKSEVNQELFDKMYGKDVVNSEEEFKAKITEEISFHLEEDGYFKFKADIKEKLMSDINFEVDNDLLKRWLLESEKIKLEKEKIEEDFPHFEKDLKWQIIKDRIIEKNELKVSEEEVIDSIKESLMMQYRQYGLTNIPEDALDKYSREFYENKEERHKFSEKILEDKVYFYLKNNVNLNFVEITHGSFEELFKVH